jgi:hypothetical protein
MQCSFDARTHVAGLLGYHIDQRSAYHGPGTATDTTFVETLRI